LDYNSGDSIEYENDGQIGGRETTEVIFQWLRVEVQDQKTDGIYGKRKLLMV
jgi:hypothetical protein